MKLCVRVSPILTALALASGAHATKAVRTPPAAPQKNPALTCGCATSRMLGRGPVEFDGQRSITAWLHGDVVLEPFRLVDSDTQARKVPQVMSLPLHLDELPLGDGAAATASRLVRVSAAGAFEPAWLGILRRGDPVARDAVAVTTTVSAEAAAPAPGPPPSLGALWLAPLEERTRPGCGTWLTHRVAFEQNPDSADVVALLVTDEARATSTLVDVRAAGVFGVGRVDVCDHGLPLQASATTLSVRPVSSTLAVGEAWRFTSDGTGQSDPVRAGVPPGASAARAAEPFPVPGQSEPPKFTIKDAALVVMGGGVVGAVGVAFLIWVVLPRRKRRMAEITCPNCHAKVPLDVLDKETDGFFCPSCGSAGLWKGGVATAAEAVRFTSLRKDGADSAGPADAGAPRA